MNTEMKDKLQKWLADEGLFREPMPDERANFHFKVSFPKGSPANLDVVQLKGKDDKVVIAAGVTVDQVHVEKMAALTTEKKDEFIWAMRELLNSFPVGFQMNHPEKVLQGFMVTAEIYEDGLSKDRFMSAILDVHRAKLAGVWEINKRFGTQGITRQEGKDDFSHYA